MKNRPRHRSSDTTQRTLLESLELRRLLSAGSFQITNALTPSLNWTPAATASANLTAAPDGSLWYTAGNTLEHDNPKGLTTTFVLPAADAGATITALAVTADNTPWLALAQNGATHIVHIASGGTFIDATPPTSAPITTLTAAGNDLWFTLGNNTLEQLTAASSPTIFHINDIGTFTALTADAQGNAWFAATTTSGDGLIGKVTPYGTITRFNIAAQTTSIAASNGTIIIGDHNALWRLSPDGTLIQTALPGITPQNLAFTSDGGVWFLDANAPTSLDRLAPDGTLTQYPTAPEIPNSLAITPNGTLWIMAPGALGTWSISGTVTTAGDNLTLFADAYGQMSVSDILIFTNGISLSEGNGTFIFEGNTGTTTTNTNNTTNDPTNPTANSSTTTSVSSTTVTSTISTTSTITTDTGQIASISPASPTTKPSSGTPIHPAGDPGIFEGEFALTPHANLPERDKTSDDSRSQSNAAPSNRSITPDSFLHAGAISSNTAVTAFILVAEPSSTPASAGTRRPQPSSPQTQPLKIPPISPPPPRQPSTPPSSGPPRSPPPQPPTQNSRPPQPSTDG